VGTAGIPGYEPEDRPGPDELNGIPGFFAVFKIRSGRNKNGSILKLSFFSRPYVATVGERGDWKVVEKYVRMQGKEPKEVQLKLW
jgi:hypothetical protein